MNFITAGRLAVLFQEAPMKITRTLEQAGVVPGLTLNELRYYPEERAVEVLRSKEERRRATAKRGVNE